MAVTLGCWGDNVDKAILTVLGRESLFQKWLLSLLLASVLKEQFCLPYLVLGTVKIEPRYGRLMLQPCLSHCSLLWEDIMTKATLTKKTFNWELAYSFRGLVHDHHGWEHGGNLEVHPGCYHHLHITSLSSSILYCKPRKRKLASWRQEEEAFSAQHLLEPWDQLLNLPSRTGPAPTWQPQLWLAYSWSRGKKARNWIPKLGN